MLQAHDLMQTKVATVEPGLPVVELERRLAREEISGMPVLEGGELVGVVSRSDVARAFTSAEGGAEATLAYYQDVAGSVPEPGAAARMAGERAATMTVRDIMTTQIVAVPAGHPVREIAQALVAGRMHRLLVTDDRRLLGIVTTLDLVRAIADGRLTEAG